MYRLRFLLLILIMYEGNRIEFLIALQQQHTHFSYDDQPYFSLSLSFSLDRLDGLSGGLEEYIRTILSLSLSLFLSAVMLLVVPTMILSLSLSFFSFSSLCMFVNIIIIQQGREGKEEKKDDLLRVIFSLLSFSF